MNLTQILSLPVLATALLTAGCGGGAGKSDKQERESAASATSATADDAAKKPAAKAEKIILDYPKSYCENVGKLKLRADVAFETSYFCVDKAPTAEMLAMREALMSSKGRDKVTTIVGKHDKENDKSEFVLVWGYHVPIRPFEVKKRPLYKFISKNLKNETIDMKADSKLRPEDEVDSGLHLWSADMHYDLKVKATNGLDLENERRTQYNLYQVLSGSEEMGFGVDSLTDKKNPDYETFVMLNLSFNDGGGYNDGKGGTIVLNLLHIVMNNRGFPVTATDSVDEIGKYLADAMYEGLTN